MRRRAGAAAIAAASLALAVVAAGPDDEVLASRHLAMPVKGVPRAALRDSFHEMRGDHRHEALDIVAPRGTPVVAMDSGRIEKLFKSVPGGLTIYQFDRDERYIYYYAHLDRYAEGLAEKQKVEKGEVIGYVGSTGNADANSPHLHFTILRVDSDKRWWKGTPVNPFPYLASEPARH